ncbi:MAG: DUF6776 family protein [Halieaceae bacterium]
MMSRSVVVQQDPRAHRRRQLLLGLACLGLFLVGIAIGGSGSLFLGIESAVENRRLREDIVSQAQQLDALRQWKIDNITRSEIDEAALELVRQQLAIQQETITELEKGVRFYKSLMAPDEIAEGLSVRSIDIKPNPDSSKYQFRILVQQSARKHALLTGTLKVSVYGQQDGAEKSYNLSDLSEQVPSDDIRLRFKYFQAIDGELELPAGFSPQLVKASARSVKPRRASFEKEFTWSVQEKISHVGQ